MFAAVGNQVIELHRERIGAIVLDDDLAPGDRPLTEEDRQRGRAAPAGLKTYH